MTKNASEGSSQKLKIPTHAHSNSVVFCSTHRISSYIKICFRPIYMPIVHAGRYDTVHTECVGRDQLLVTTTIVFNSPISQVETKSSKYMLNTSQIFVWDETQ